MKNIQYLSRIAVPLIAAVLTVSTLGELQDNLLAETAYARTVTITTTADERNANGACSLREAIINANADNQSGSTDCLAGSGADTITFGVTGTITLSSRLPDVTGNLTISGPGAESLAISGNHSVQVLYIPVLSTVTLSGLTIQDGTNIPDSGGAIDNYGTLTVSACTFSGNSAPFTNGGAIYNEGGTLVVRNSTFSGNIGAGGGAITLYYGTTTVSNSTFSGNTTSGTGGGSTISLEP